MLDRLAWCTYPTNSSSPLAAAQHVRLHHHLLIQYQGEASTMELSKDEARWHSAPSAVADVAAALALARDAHLRSGRAAAAAAVAQTAGMQQHR